MRVLMTILAGAAVLASMNPALAQHGPSPDDDAAVGAAVGAAILGGVVGGLIGASAARGHRAGTVVVRGAGDFAGEPLGRGGKGGGRAGKQRHPPGIR